MPMFVSKDSRWVSPNQSHPVKLDEFVTLAQCDMGETSVAADRGRALQAIPLYWQPFETATERGEKAQYLVSLDANVACKETIESAIARHYRSHDFFRPCYGSNFSFSHPAETPVNTPSQEDVSDYEFLKDVLLLLSLCVENRAGRVGLSGNGG